MATITPGTGATIQANKAESQLFYALMLLQKIETDINYNSGTNRKDCVQTTFNDNTSTFTAVVNIPCEATITDDGKPTFTGINYLNNYAFSPGSPSGTFKSINLPAYVIEVLYYCQMLENDITKNPGNKNFINGSYDSERNRFNGTVTLPYTKTLLDTGDVTFSIPEYLLIP